MTTRTKKAKAEKVIKETRLDLANAALYPAREAKSEAYAAANKARAARIDAIGGCKRCNGCGWYQAYYTMDYMHGESMSCDCIGEKRVATAAAYAYTEAEVAALQKACDAVSDIEATIAREESAREPRVGFMVRVVKGRKVAKGDYQCRKAGNGQHGTWLLLADASGATAITDYDNCVGLVECKGCATYGTTDEIAFDFDFVKCGPCLDRMRDAGEIE